MAGKTVRLPRPLEHQLPILLSPARYKVVAAGRRFGKSLLGLVAVLSGHGPREKTFKGALDGGTIWWVAPTYPIASLIWRHLKRATVDAWATKNETERRISLPGGGSVTVKSADNPDSLRGAGLDGVVFDEAAFIAESAWKEAIRPALSDRQGWALFLSTPNGTNWFYELFRGAEERDNWGAWQLSTIANKLIPPEELEDARRELGTLKFEQEYEARFVSRTGGLFRREWFRYAEAQEVPKDLAVVRGWDLAASRVKKGSDPDFTAGAKLGLKDGIYWVLDIQRLRDTPRMAESLIFRSAREDGTKVPIVFEVEPGASGLHLLDHYQRHVLKGFAVYGDRKITNKVASWQPFAAAAEAGNVVIVRAPWNNAFLDEAESLTTDDSHAHDDQMDAACVAMRQLVKGAGRTGPMVW